MLFSGARMRCQAPPSQISLAVCFRALFVHGPGRDVAGIARTKCIGASVIAEDERDGPVQHKQSRVELVRM
jgi:hypothetical protein